jgi:hypothetical protein
MIDFESRFAPSVAIQWASISALSVAIELIIALQVVETVEIIR